jgi:uncharacterized protein YdeI (YjbR/CyaY-like superfamily)
VADTTPELVVADVAAWQAWLAENADDPRGVWLLLAKKGTTTPTSLTYAQALDEALCQGWIDGQTNRVDDRTYRQRYTPRRARSLWSRRNISYVARLTAEGRMCPRGFAEVARAQADGRWDAAYAGSASIEMPEDLALALQAEPAAQTLFDRLNAQNRYAVLFRVTTAVAAATRARRIATLVAMLAAGRTPFPQRGLTEPGLTEPGLTEPA